MSIPIINDFRKPQLSKTEKAIAVLEAENQMLKNWCQGLQRQIAGICLHLKILPSQFTSNTNKPEEINKFLEEAQKAEELIVKARQREAEEQARIVKLNENVADKN